MMKYCTYTAAVAIALLWAPTGAAQTVDSLRVMTYNIWFGGINDSGQPLSQTVSVIQAAQADVVGLQEQNGSGQAIAASLGFHYRGLGGSTAILSRYPIVENLSFGAKLQLSPTQTAYIFDVHLTAFPYQPYDILEEINNGVPLTEAQVIAGALSTRSPSPVLNEMTTALGSGIPAFLTGDFNEPSHLDWTQDAATAGLNFGMKVDWPTSHAVTNAGLVDAFRELRPDEVNDRGETWTPGRPAPSQVPGEVHDRIDFVYYAGVNVVPTTALVLGHDANDPNTDIVVHPYPSDHRSVVVEFDVPACSMLADFNRNCTIGTEDWSQFRGGQHANMTGLSPLQAYELGDLNGDFRNNHADFVIFKTAFETANGAGSFANLFVQVPEPSSMALTAWVALACIGSSRICRGHRPRLQF